MPRSVLDCFVVAEHIGPNGEKALGRLVELQTDLSFAVQTGELMVSAQAMLEDRLLQLAEDIACELRKPELPPVAEAEPVQPAPVVELPPVAEPLLAELGVDQAEGQ